MSNYKIITDSSCDLPIKLVEETGVCVIPLSFVIDGREYMNYPDERDMATEEFYSLLRQGKMAKTSALGINDFEERMTPMLEQGYDILYIGFSSSLSSTYDSGEAAAKILRERYPERTILTIDTLSASAGMGLIVYLAAKMRDSGADIYAIRDYVESIKLSLAHWFTVDDLSHLKRGGRISAGAATLGTILHIKPVMHGDNSGRLAVVTKVRGRKMALRRLIEIMKDSIVAPKEQLVFISHADCYDEAQEFKQQILQSLPVKGVQICDIGPVIGAHCGPGTIAVFYIATQR